MESHGGYLIRDDRRGLKLEHLKQIARQALGDEGLTSEDCALQWSHFPGTTLSRLAFDGPFSYGKAGALWYRQHHALARLLSLELGQTVHAYALDPLTFEHVSTYGEGQKVGGTEVHYAQEEWPDGLEGDDEDSLNQVLFSKLQAQWPLGRLGRMLGIGREDLLKLPRMPSILLNLEAGPLLTGVDEAQP